MILDFHFVLYCYLQAYHRSVWTLTWLLKKPFILMLWGEMEHTKPT